MASRRVAIWGAWCVVLLLVGFFSLNALAGAWLRHVTEGKVTFESIAVIPAVDLRGVTVLDARGDAVAAVPRVPRTMDRTT